MSWLPVQTMAQVAVERILNALPEGLLIAVFAWALLRVLRRQNSGTRFAVWFLALLAVAALPLLGFGEGRSLLAGVPSFVSSAPSWASMHPAVTIPAHWGLLVFLLWALGVCVAILRLAVGLWRLRQLRRSCTAIGFADIDPAVRKTMDTIVASGSVTIATSESVRVPAAIGFWKRTIVLPAWALRELPPQDLNVILLHEFAHLRRWDDWTNLIQKMVRALFFFHPAVWWIENRLSVEREMACDDAVLAETADPHGYASCLVSLLEKSLAHRLEQPRWSMAQAAVNRARDAALRLAQILDKDRPAATRVWKPALGMVGACAVVCLMMLSQAPQFVAFDRGMAANHSDHPYSAALSHASFKSSLQPARQLSSRQAAFQPAAVIPAALTTKEASPLRSNVKFVHARVLANTLANNGAQPQPVLVRERVVEVNAVADQELVPQFRTMVFIEATQYTNSDSLVWSVQVWQVVFVDSLRERLTRVPVANSI
jgi:beta-lactamase regulating signal transducer with metallopeptidase domain